MPGPANKNEQYPMILSCLCNCDIHYSREQICPMEAMNSRKFTHNNLSTTNIPTHYGSGIMYGIEIEVEVDNQIAVLDSFCLQNYYVIKLEQSVPCGLEFVSAPMSFCFHIIQMRKLYDWFQALNAGGKNTVWSSEKTGIHFHIQKEKVSDRNLQWLSNYLTGNQRNIDIFAGRKENKFCARTGDITNTDKKSAIRITPETIELRIFTTFMDYANIIQRLAIVNRILHTS